MQHRIIVSILVILIVSILAVPSALAQPELGGPSYVSGGLYTAPYGRGTYLGWVYGQAVIQSGSGGWYLTRAGWVQGVVSSSWTGGFGSNVTAGLSYWSQYNSPPATWW
ncbi:MAG: hypothetical protein KKA73_18290 [Chloroflexi bacterium]|nr:hypothetical protein [Chloroflexota bacterium]MBU1749637.1 hypothetical protein [Chloroflexota bacterium]